MNYDDLPLQVVKDLWLARFGTAVEFDRLSKIHRQECTALADGESKHRTPINRMYKRLTNENAVELRYDNDVCWAYFVEDPHAGP